MGDLGNTPTPFKSNGNPMEVLLETHGRVPWAITIYPSEPHGSLMGTLQTHGSSMEAPWQTHESFVGQHNKPIDAPRESHGRPMKAPLDRAMRS